MVLVSRLSSICWFDTLRNLVVRFVELSNLAAQIWVAKFVSYFCTAKAKLLPEQKHSCLRQTEHITLPRWFARL